MSVTTRFADSAKRLTNRFGSCVDYIRTVEGSYDIDTGDVTDTTESTTKVKAFKSNSNKTDEQSPDLVGREVFTYLIAGCDLPFVPATDDKIQYTYLNETFTVVVKVVREQWAGNRVAMWQLTCISE